MKYFLLRKRFYGDLIHFFHFSIKKNNKYKELGINHYRFIMTFITFGIRRTTDE